MEIDKLQQKKVLGGGPLNHKQAEMDKIDANIDNFDFNPPADHFGSNPKGGNDTTIPLAMGETMNSGRPMVIA